MKKICVVIGSRANYSSIKSAMRAINDHAGLTLQVVVFASALLDRYGSVVNLIEADGFQVDSKIYNILEGENPLTMAKSTGLGLIELPTVFDQLMPDVVVTVGDRFETMATTLAAAYMNIPIAHTMGGEVTGTIDESIRHAVTKFSHIHFPASEGARDRIIRLGEREEDVHLVGCPRIDLVKEIIDKGIDPDYLNEKLNEIGVGNKVDVNLPFLLVSQHPVTTEYGDGEEQILNTLKAASKIGLSTIVLWPNSDAGSEDISRGIRKWREKGLDKKMHFFKNLPIDVYVGLMKKTVSLVGNSSSGIREGAFIGTPCVNVGSRQTLRERGANVIEIPSNVEAIIEAIQLHINHGSYSSNPLYGDGNAGIKIAEVLSKKEVILQKQITY
jgi:UDP-hydrolysing UDP-N-acetyl-D-glucosamine 2-epimerase